MKRTLILAALLALGLAPGANAATSISLTSDSPTYLAGGTITLTVTVTQDAAETDNAVFGAVNIEDTKINPGVRNQTVLPNGPWNPGALNCTSVFCVLFSQVRPSGVASVNVTNFVIATATFTVEPDEVAGTTISFIWRTTPTTQRLDWYGITNAPGVTVTVIPEPTTAAMLGLGLFGLAMAGRRRA